VNQITTIGMDLAKQVNHIVGVNAAHREVLKKKLRRKQVLEFFANLPPCTVAMEACAGAHEWARQLELLGHRVLLIPPNLVKGYLQGNKNDYNDARALIEASRRPKLRPVPVKTREQQDLQALHRIRKRQISARTALSNQIRGLLAEYGLVLPKGLATLRRRLPEILEDAENELSDLFRRLLNQCLQQLKAMDEQIEFYSGMIHEQSAQSEPQQQLKRLAGFGPIVASAFHGKVGDGSGFQRGRDVSAAIGLVPGQHSTGDKPRLLGISKRGDRYLRTLLIHGARAVINRADGKDDPQSRWIQRLVARRGKNKATVALANKMARVGWAVLRNGTDYDPAKAFAAAP
jgi:transposase